MADRGTALKPPDTNSWVGGILYILGPCGSLQQTLLWGWEFLPLLQSPQNFSDRGFEALFPHAGTLGWAVCLSPQLFLLVYPRLYISYHTIVIPNPTYQPSMVLIHFAIFLSFILVVVNFIFSHTMPSFYPLSSLFLVHLTSHKHSSYLSPLTFFSPFNKSLISCLPFINSG